MKTQLYSRGLAFGALALTLLISPLSAQTLYTPSGTVSNGGPGGVGIGILNPAAPLDVVGNNILLRPSPFFNPNGKFIGIGESGGVVGPINGCDLYGFRAQRDQNSFINVGIRTETRSEPVINDVPTISFGGVTNGGTFVTGKPLEFRNKLTTTGGCGTLIASMTSIGSFRFRVFGSALASGGSWVNSDARFKQNIQPIGNAMDMISRLEGKTYSFDLENFPERGFNSGLQFGFIAQELQLVMPEAVMADEDGFLGVNYDAVIPVMVEGMKDQQAMIDAQQAQMEEQQSVLEQQDAVIRQLQEDLRALQSELRVERKVSQTSTENAQLFQNRPNPFRESTEIYFYLPETVSQASLVVYNLAGKEMLRFENLNRGYASIFLEGGQLMAGDYIYRLIADDEVVASKQLILSK